MAVFTGWLELSLALLSCAFVVATIAADKGYPFGAGLVLGLGLPFVSVGLVIALPRRSPED